MFILISLVIYVFIELLYFKIADHYNIVDKPNERSSHRRLIIRGGGIIFPLSILAAIVYSGNYYMFGAGLALVSLVSFADDIKSLPGLFRSIVHFIAIILLISNADPGLSPYWYVILSIVIAGTINSWNFMDGINGITGGYSLVTIGSLYYVNNYILEFTDNYLILSAIASLLVFGFFNFRKRAKCFAGDVGSISIAFFVCFLLFQLIVKSGNLIFIGFLLMYGLDAVSSIAFRLIRKENISQPHRTHFYQYLANEMKHAHLKVAGLYSLAQLVINICLVSYILLIPDQGEYNIIPILTICITAAFIFFLIRWRLEGREKLMGRKLP